MCGLGYAGRVRVRLSLGRRREPRAALCRDVSRCDMSRQSIGRSNCLSKLLLRSAMQEREAPSTFRRFRHSRTPAGVADVEPHPRRRCTFFALFPPS